MANTARSLIATLLPTEPPADPAAAVRLLFFAQLDQLACHADTARFAASVEDQLDSLTLQFQELVELLEEIDSPDVGRAAKICANAANYLAFLLARAIELRNLRTA